METTQDYFAMKGPAEVGAPVTRSPRQGPRSPRDKPVASGEDLNPPVRKKKVKKTKKRVDDSPIQISPPPSRNIIVQERTIQERIIPQAPKRRPPLGKYPGVGYTWTGYPEEEPLKLAPGSLYAGNKNRSKWEECNCHGVICIFIFSGVLAALMITPAVFNRLVHRYKSPRNDFVLPIPGPKVKNACLNLKPVNVKTNEDIAALISKMTLTEKVAQMVMAADYNLRPGDVSSFSIGQALSGPALGVSDPEKITPSSWLNAVSKLQAETGRTRWRIPLMFGVDAPHGWSMAFDATVFPHNIGLGATRNPALARRIAEVTSRELIAAGIRWHFAPCIAVCRDARWGRCYEAFGEDPELVSNFTEVVAGYQQPNGTLGNLGTLATIKHFVGDGGTQIGKNTGNVVITDNNYTDFFNMHLTPYKTAIDKWGAKAIMISFHQINQVRMTANKNLITGLLKGNMSFSGVVVSDWLATKMLDGSYNDQIKQAVNAGVDLFMMADEWYTFMQAMLNNIQAGAIDIERVNDAVNRILKVKRDFGFFSTPCAGAASNAELNKYINTDEHKAVARQAVRESMVLLQNGGYKKPITFPIDLKGKKVLVAGSHANNIGYQAGGWTTTWQGSFGATFPGTTFYQALQKAVGKNASISLSYTGKNISTAFDPGNLQPIPANYSSTEYDLGIVVVGEMPYAETAGDDLNYLLLNPDAQLAIYNVCDRMPCIVILMSGRPLVIEQWLPRINMFIAAWLPGGEGAGLTDVLFGDYDFTGRLPVSWFHNETQLGDPNWRQDSLFPFGYGLNKQGSVLA